MKLDFWTTVIIIIITCKNSDSVLLYWYKIKWINPLG